MASPTFVAEPASRTNPAASSARMAHILLLLGGLLLLVPALTHPSGNEPATVSAFAAWTEVHVIGAIGVALVGMSALVRLVGGNVPNRAGVLGMAGIVVFAPLTVAALAIDGFASSALATIDGSASSDAIRNVVVSIERALASFGYGGFGLSAALVTFAHLGRSGMALRIGGAVAGAGMLALAGAGILYIGLDLPLEFLFAGMPVTALWFVAVGAREAFRGTTRAGPAGSARPATGR